MLLITIPHSGELIPAETPWLENLPEQVIMCDVDRFVDQLYEPSTNQLGIPTVTTQWHRYAGDLNRIPDDIDEESVLNAKNPPGTFSRGFHWVVTTLGTRLQTQPMTHETHEKLVKKIYEPFHLEIQSKLSMIRKDSERIYHIDAHSMPSVGTMMHRDPGERRADIVVSDCKGESSSLKFRDLVIAAYVTAGFKVAYNWPYLGGRMTEQYGNPQNLHDCIQVELNRSLYMDEVTKKIKPDLFKTTQQNIYKALSYIQNNLKTS